MPSRPASAQRNHLPEGYPRPHEPGHQQALDEGVEGQLRVSFLDLQYGCFQANLKQHTDRMQHRVQGEDHRLDDVHEGLRYPEENNLEIEKPKKLVLRKENRGPWRKGHVPTCLEYTLLCLALPSFELVGATKCLRCARSEDSLPVFTTKFKSYLDHGQGKNFPGSGKAQLSLLLA